MTDTALDRAEAAGRTMLEAKPWAINVRFDAASGRVVIALTTGCAYAFPPLLVQDLRDARPTSLTLNPAVKLAPVAESPAPFSDERKSPPEAAAPIG